MITSSSPPDFGRPLCFTSGGSHLPIFHISSLDLWIANNPWPPPPATGSRQQPPSPFPHLWRDQTRIIPLATNTDDPLGRDPLQSFPPMAAINFQPLNFGNLDHLSSSPISVERLRQPPDPPSIIDPLSGNTSSSRTPSPIQTSGNRMPPETSAFHHSHSGDL